MEKYDNIVIGANYTEDLCQQAYGETWIQLGKLQGTYPKNVSSTQCESKFKEIRRALQDLVTQGALEKSEKVKKIE